MRSRDEDAIQAAIVEALRTIGVLVFAVPNGGGRSKIEAAILKRLGVLAGVPDLIVVHQGSIVGIEVKRPKMGPRKPAGVVSEAQKDVIAQLGRHGVPTLIARSIQDALSGLEALGILQHYRKISVRL